MNKILIKLYVPILEEQYDVKIPVNRKLYKVILLLIKAVNELSGGYYNPDKNNLPLLYDKVTAKPYDTNLSVKENNIKNGTEIILI